MMQQFTQSMIGWFTMVMIMGYFIWNELQKNELELEEEDEPPSSRLAIAVASVP